MPELDSETWGHLGFWLYYLIGLPIAWGYAQRNDMMKSAQRDGSFRLVIGMLAILWPVLLFARSANRAVEKGKSRKAESSAEKSGKEDHAGN